MEAPKLRSRPYSTAVCTTFRGLDRLPGASNRTRNKTWNMGWHDERNLSSDRWPRLSVRKARGTADIDGNEPVDRIIGMCGGDHALLLTAAGDLWCNGNSVYLAGQDGVKYSWSVSGFSVTPSSGITGFDPTADAIQSVLWDAWEGHWGRATLVYDPAGAPGSWHWHWIEGDLWTNLTALGLIAGAFPRQGDSFTVTFDTSCTFGDHPQIVRMGAYAIVYPGWMWVNAVKLAAGDELVEGEDYGPFQGLAYASAGTITMTLCDIEGNAYSGVVVSTTEPINQEGYWLDTSQAKPVLREWNYIQTTWVTVASTWIKIETVYHETLGNDTIRKGDGVTIAAECANGTDAGVVELLNKEHFIYDANIDENSGGWIMVAGILPASTVTVTLTDTMTVSRTLPTLDFLVEAQNRLWGCRYSEADNLNEIYASKLGDFRNWNVFQGLSTDSWTASRGTPAPFTGAVALGGNPLFFREEWLEKVFPSSSGGHQIQTYSLEGVQEGSDRSLVIIDERLYYKSRPGVCVYTGTLPTRISEEFNDWLFSSATAARHGDKYVCCMTGADGGHLCLVYDLATGDWHVEDETWDDIAITWKDVCYYVKDGEIFAFNSGNGSAGVEWYAESDDMAVELPEHKWISFINIRLMMELGASCRVYISYDDGPWLRKASLRGNRLHTVEIANWPRRSDHFRLRFEGTGGVEIQSISYRLERSQGH